VDFPKLLGLLASVAGFLAAMIAIGKFLMWGARRCGSFMESHQLKRPKRMPSQEAYTQLLVDGSSLFHASDKCHVEQFAALYSNNAPNHVFINLRIPKDITFVHLALFRKLRECQRLGWYPSIGLVVDDNLAAGRQPEEMDSRVDKIKKVVRYYLGKRCKISTVYLVSPNHIGKRRRHHSISTNVSRRIVSMLSKLDMGQLLTFCNAAKSHKNRALSALLPLAEIAYVAEQPCSYCVVCGPDTLEVWRFAAKHLEIAPLILCVPELRDLSGAMASTEKGLTLSDALDDTDKLRRSLSMVSDISLLTNYYDLVILGSPLYSDGIINIPIGSKIVTLRCPCAKHLGKINEKIAREALACDLGKKLSDLAKEILE